MLTGSWEIAEEKKDWRGITLYRARQVETGEEYLLEDLALATETRERIYREIVTGLEQCADKAGAVNHAAIRRPVGVTRHQERYLIVRPYDPQLWEGWGARPTPADPAELGRWLQIIAEVLAAYHQAGLTTRGLAGNDLVRAGDGVAVLDPVCESYLLAYRDREQVQRYELAPEVTRGKPWTGASDIFAFGLNAYKLATGRLPFAGSSAVLIDNLLAQTVVDPRADTPALGPALAGTLLALLARDPAHRPEAAAVAGQLAEQGAKGWWTATPAQQGEFARSGRKVAGMLVRRERLFGFLRRNRLAVAIGAAAIAVVSLLFAFRGHPPAPTITSTTSPAQVVAAYYRAIDTFDIDLLEQTLAPKTGGNVRQMVMTLYVVSKTAMAYEMQRGAAAADWRQLRLAGLRITRIRQSPPGFKADYEMVLRKGEMDEITTREDLLTFGRIKSRRVGQKWVIAKLVQKETGKRIVKHEIEAAGGHQPIAPGDKKTPPR